MYVDGQSEEPGRRLPRERVPLGELERNDQEPEGRLEAATSGEAEIVATTAGPAQTTKLERNVQEAKERMEEMNGREAEVVAATEDQRERTFSLDRRVATYTRDQRAKRAASGTELREGAVMRCPALLLGAV